MMSKLNSLYVSFLALIMAGVALGLSIHNGAQKQAASVEETLNNNPEIIINAMQNYEQKLREQAIAEAQKLVEENLPALNNDANTPFIGAVDAPVVLVEFFDQFVGHSGRFLVRSGGLVLHSQLEPAGIPEARNGRGQEELNFGVLDMGCSFGVDFEQLSRRFVAFVPGFEVDHSHAVAGIFGFGHQAVAGQRGDGLDLFHRQQGGLDLVEGLFGTLQRGSRRGVDVDVNHPLVVVGDETGRQYTADSPGAQKEQQQRSVGHHPAVEVFPQAEVVTFFEPVVSPVEDDEEASQQVGTFALAVVVA